jgi:hypothetical protein
MASRGVTLAISTSSPRVCIGLFSEEGSFIAESSELSLRNASSVAHRLIDRLFSEHGLTWDDVAGLAVDEGPGSFTGVKVGVTLVKVWAAVQGNLVWAAPAFDLISTTKAVAIPQKKGVLFVREPGLEPVTMESEGCDSWAGYGFLGKSEYPRWSALTQSVASYPAFTPVALVPEYGAEPSISSPKVPFPSSTA